MAEWRHVSAGFKPGERRSARAHSELTAAYLNVFGRDDGAAEIVLADLADYCGFYSVAEPGTSADRLFYEQGLRAAYARIFAFLSLKPERLTALEMAARAESLVNDEEGII